MAKDPKKEEERRLRAQALKDTGYKRGAIVATRAGRAGHMGKKRIPSQKYEQMLDGAKLPKEAAIRLKELKDAKIAEEKHEAAVAEATGRAMTDATPPTRERDPYGYKDGESTFSIVERQVIGDSVIYTVSASFDSPFAAEEYMADQKHRFATTPRYPDTQTSFYISRDEEPHNAYYQRTILDKNGQETLNGWGTVLGDTNGVNSEPAAANRLQHLKGDDLVKANTEIHRRRLDTQDKREAEKKKDVERMRADALKKHGFMEQSPGYKEMVSGSLRLPPGVSDDFREAYDARYPSMREVFNTIAAPEKGMPRAPVYEQHHRTMYETDSYLHQHRQSHTGGVYEYRQQPQGGVTDAGQAQSLSGSGIPPATLGETFDKLADQLRATDPAAAKQVEMLKEAVLGQGADAGKGPATETPEAPDKKKTPAVIDLGF